jgi:hypothetical protein
VTGGINDQMHPSDEFEKNFFYGFCLRTLNRNRTMSSFVIALLPLIQLWLFPGAMSHCEIAVSRKLLPIKKTI